MTRLRIGVIGQSGQISPDVEQVAEAVGREIAGRGAVLLCGGRDGVMEAACRGARAAGGLTVGVLPGDDLAEGNPHLDVALTTGLDMDARSLVLVHSCDAVVVVAGANGTLLEISAAYRLGIPIVALPSTGGWSERLRAAAYEDGRYLDARRTVRIEYAATAQEAVALAVELATARRAGETRDQRGARRRTAM